MYFEKLNDIIENFCYSHDFEPYGEPDFNYEEQFVIYNIPNSFFIFKKIRHQRHRQVKRDVN